MQPMQPTATRGKEKVVAGILGILLNGLGIHHFYLGSTGAGVVVLLSNILCGLGCLIGLVEGIMLLVMSDAEFNQRYNLRTPESMEFVFMKPKTLPPPYQA
jgi:TM2 domain-containing membrane protein YozV